MAKAKVKYTIDDLIKAKETKKTFDAYVQSVDNRCNLRCVFADNIEAIIPREEVSVIVSSQDGLVEEEVCQKKKGKIMQVIIKELVIKEGKIEQAILSRRELELKVRKWLYMFLKPGMKLKGIVRGLTDYAAFVDLGGGVTGLMKVEDISNVKISRPQDKLKFGQRVEVVVKSFDRDTGKIALSMKELCKGFDELVKTIKEGDIVDGVARAKTRNCIFVEIKGGLTGIAEAVNGIEYGQKVLVYIKRINVEKQKIKLEIIG